MKKLEYYTHMSYFLLKIQRADQKALELLNLMSQ